MGKVPDDRQFLERHYYSGTKRIVDCIINKTFYLFAFHKMVSTQLTQKSQTISNADATAVAERRTNKTTSKIKNDSNLVAFSFKTISSRNGCKVYSKI
ncbi:hypothetical protein TNCT_532161 [Trichonephila clavata]|uniref:Uncharacterized protein n=1 Tax=Trichonephila clavata TaxID=2740835 RepID=A0A8X6F0Q7_TRICU|nr:hypothetical protein TNCT_532161 [Trichonephila clavata]